MGIAGLIPFLKKASRPANVKEFSGCVAAIDLYCWLHKGVYSCADRLVKGEKTDGYVHYCVKMVNILLSMNVTPILVFDGRRLPAKADVEKNRREQREKNKKKGTSLLREGKLKEAHDCFKRAVDVTPEMALHVMQACRRLNVDCIVAPYEADAQLAYLSKSGIAQVIITEDSDLVLFGCEKIIFKMDCNGHGVLVDQSRLHTCMNVNAANFSFQKFRRMCIMSGCDYLPSLPGIGLAKACKFFVAVTNTDLNIILRKIPTYLKMPQLSVSTKYVQDFMKAENTFLYQLAFDPRSRALAPLNPYPEEIDPLTMDYAGEYLPNDLAYEMAKGNIDLHTMKTVDNFDPKQEELSTKRRNSIWSVHFIPRQPLSSDNVNEIDHQLTRGKEVVVSAKIICRKIQRKRSEKEEANDEDIINLYRSSPVKKKSKIESDNECVNDDSDFVEIRSNISPENNLLNQVLSVTTNKKNKFKIQSPDKQIKKCVRSRFFNESGSQQSSKVLSWFDEIASEYDHGSKKTTDANGSSQNASFWDKIESPALSEKEDLIVKPAEKENVVDDDILCTPKSQSNFAWKKLRKFSFEKSDIPIQSTPVSWAPYKSPGIVKRQFSLDSSQASEYSETINSIDNDSFNLSQATRDSAFSQGESNNSTVGNVDNSQISNQSLKSTLEETTECGSDVEDEPKKISPKITPKTTSVVANKGKAKKLGNCRQSGLYKKSKFARDKNQISITDALSKFHYVKRVNSKSLSTIMG